MKPHTALAAIVLSTAAVSCSSPPSAETEAICQGAVDAVGLVVDFSGDPTNDDGFTTLEGLEGVAADYRDRVAGFQGAFRRNLNRLENEPNLDNVPDDIRSSYETAFEAAIDVGLGDTEAADTAEDAIVDLLVACADIYD